MGLHCGEADFCHHPNMQGFDHFYGLPLTNLKDFGPEGYTVTKSRIPHIDHYLVVAAVMGVVTALFFRKTFGTVLTLLFLVCCFCLRPWLLLCVSVRVNNAVALR